MLLIHRSKAKKIVRSKLESVMNGDSLLYNEVSKSYVDVTEDRIEGMVDMFIEILSGHGIKHLKFIENNKQPSLMDIIFEEDKDDIRFDLEEDKTYEK